MFRTSFVLVAAVLAAPGSAGVVGPVTAQEDLALARADSTPSADAAGRFFFPTAGEAEELQDRRTPRDVGLDPRVVDALHDVIVHGRWALWRHGHLVAVDGPFNDVVFVASVRKTILAAMVGTAIQQRRLASVHEPIRRWVPELVGAGDEITWWHVLTQTSALDDPRRPPGSIWAYSDANAQVLSLAVARVWGNPVIRRNSEEFLWTALLQDIGALGWRSVPDTDGIHLKMDLEDMGRFGLLMAAGGTWNGKRLLPEAFVRALTTKQPRAVPPDYRNPNDGIVGLRVADFPNAPYGYMTWVNTDGDLWPGAARTWAAAFGWMTAPASGVVRGSYIAWEPHSGLVLAAQHVTLRPRAGSRPGWPLALGEPLSTLQAHIAGPDPLASDSPALVSAAPRRPR